MCGIAGFCNRQKTWREDMERMKEQLISRGPDAEGSWCNDSQDIQNLQTLSTKKRKMMLKEVRFLR